MLGLRHRPSRAYALAKAYARSTCKNCSTDSAPRVPPLKLSMNLMHRLSKGTVVPPEVTHTIGRPLNPSAGVCLRMNACTEDPIEVDGAGASSKNSSTVYLLCSGDCILSLRSLGLGTPSLLIARLQRSKLRAQTRRYKSNEPFPAEPISMRA